MGDTEAAADARARHETLNSLFKNFNILQTAYRHEYGSHEEVTFAIAVMINIGLDERPRWPVAYNVVY